MATAQKRTSSPPQEMPDVLGGVVPYLNVSNAGAAADFYVKAFGAKEVFRYPPDEKGRHMHIHLHLNGGSLMLSDPFPEHGCEHKDPQGFNLHMKVQGIDKAFQRAVDAGATVVMPVQKMFWGDRYGQLRDPFGVTWAMGEPDPVG
jgi:PhnB protein